MMHSIFTLLFLATLSLTIVMSVPLDPPSTPSVAQEASSVAASISASGAPVQSGTSTSSTGSSGDSKAWLDAHNTFRSQHGAKALTWNDEAASKAKEYASKCQFNHSGGSLGPYGENLASGTGDYTVAAAFKSWSDEAKDYNPAKPDDSHFTQVVWKSTTELGCAMVDCDPGTIFKDKSKFAVCEYSPPGNVEGKESDNVQK